MSAVKEHYENLLAEYYSWMSGGFSRKVQQNREFFRYHNVRPSHSGVAVDLGAGCGFQSIPLAQAGFTVAAIDTSKKLLDELRRNAPDLAIKTINDDLSNFDSHCAEPIELIVCMGDTLTHLQTRKIILHLLRKAYRSLEPDGKLILAFRDLSVVLTGLDRFVSVQNDANCIFTCFLEFEKNRVKIHDLIYKRTHGGWVFKKGVYEKLRIAPEWIKELLEALGFRIETFDIRNGLVLAIARK
jgi:SAM-dependent methyltransferase